MRESASLFITVSWSCIPTRSDFGVKSSDERD